MDEPISSLDQNPTSRPLLSAVPDRRQLSKCFTLANGQIQLHAAGPLCPGLTSCSVCCAAHPQGKLRSRASSPWRPGPSLQGWGAIGEPAPNLIRPPWQPISRKGRFGSFISCHCGCEEAQSRPPDRSWQGDLSPRPANGPGDRPTNSRAPAGEPFCADAPENIYTFQPDKPLEAENPVAVCVRTAILRPHTALTATEAPLRASMKRTHHP